MDNLIKTIKRIFLREHQTAPTDGQDLALDGSAVQRLMLILEKTEEGQYSCEETFELLDEYVDLVVDDQQAELIMPLVKGHLECCKECRARYETLLAILETP